VSLWSRAVAASYDRMTEGSERAGFAAERSALLADARGRVLEVGAGTGRNVPHYPPGTNVTYTEPDPHMADRLRARGKSVVPATVQQLPFADDSFETVVSTLVLCSVPDVPAALAEIRRVLAPGGRLLFIEHVRGEPGTPLERWQNRLNRPWRAVARGCNCNRDLLAELEASGFAPEGVRCGRESFMPPLLRRLARGTAAC
jgi:ubiquinone/menaquinone biosynthesis C-methylase UbiE